MTPEEILLDKRILLVDDEPDILETVEELLTGCCTDTAASFQQALESLKTREYDAVILDVMGVDGLSLLKITRKKNIPAIMLTAHALTPDHLKASLEQGADAYVPKEKMADIALFLSDVLQARQQGRRAHSSWFSVLEPLFNKLFGKEWRSDDRDFWDQFDDSSSK